MATYDPQAVGVVQNMIKEALDRRGISGAELARQINVDENDLERACHSQATRDRGTLNKVARALALDPTLIHGILHGSIEIEVKKPARPRNCQQPRTNSVIEFPTHHVPVGIDKAPRRAPKKNRVETLDDEVRDLRQRIRKQNRHIEEQDARIEQQWTVIRELQDQLADMMRQRRHTA